MVRIEQAAYGSPDSTYFRVGDVEPELEEDESGQVLRLTNGVGRARNSWGHPGVTSTVIVDDESLVAIHIGFYHKHGGGQFWRYYVPDERGTFCQVNWQRLSDIQRGWVLDNLETKAPDWAKLPGKLRDEYTHPAYTTAIAYKLVQVSGDQHLRSVYNPNVVYELGRRMVERAVGNHGGGYYSFLSLENLQDLLSRDTVFPQSRRVPMTLALLEVEIGGRRIQYGYKVASTYLTPKAVIEYLDYVPQREQQVA